jgi:arabinogalactan endo-1,4-beta-galactosidase
MTLTTAMMLVAAPYWRGADMSFVPEYRDLKCDYFVGKTKTDSLKAMKDAGMNMLRLRVWVNPPKGYCNPERTVKLAVEAKKMGMELMIDFHYSDDWADPAKQYPPALWKNYNVQEMSAATKKHTTEVLLALKKEGVHPKIVAIGNEIRTGMLWPLGEISKNGYENFATFLKAGIEGAKEAKMRPFQIMIHNDAGGDKAGCDQFYSSLMKLGVKFDVIGLSYYPWWHGTMEQLKENMDNLAEKFKKPVIVTETAYPFTYAWKDKTGNFVWEKTKLNCDFPATPEGQGQFLTKLHSLVKSISGGQGQGVLYWAPEYVAHPGIETPCENLCLFDFDNRMLPGAYALFEKRSN